MTKSAENWREWAQIRFVCDSRKFEDIVQIEKIIGDKPLRMGPWMKCYSQNIDGLRKTAEKLCGLSFVTTLYFEVSRDLMMKDLTSLKPTS